MTRRPDGEEHKEDENVVSYDAMGNILCDFTAEEFEQVKMPLLVTPIMTTLFGDNPGEPHSDASQRFIGYLADTKSLGLALTPKFPFETYFSAYVHADYAHFLGTRKWILGSLLFWTVP